MASLLLLAIGYRLSAVSGALARYGALWGAIFYTALAAKTIQPPCGRENASPFGGWRHHLARWEACHLILSRLRLLANQVPLPPGGKHVTGFSVAYGSLRIQFLCHPPQFGGTAKGKRLNGQARRLTSPHLAVLCRTSTVAL